MNKQISVSIIFILFAQVSLSQTTPTMMETTRDALRTGAKIGTNASQTLYGIPRPYGKVEGDYYLDSTFVNSSILLFNETKPYDNVMARFDIKNNLLEIDTPSGIRLVDGMRVKFFTLNTALRPDGIIFMNAYNFRDDADNLKGFFELVADGKTSLLIFHKAWEKKASYNEALGVGDINTKIIKEQTFYLAKVDGAKKIGNSKKNLFEAMSDHRPEIEKFLKDGNYNLKSKADLVTILNYYNGLSLSK
jgi:hypothetical protein